MTDRSSHTQRCEHALAQAKLAAPIEPTTVVGMAHDTEPDDLRVPPQACLKATASAVEPGPPIPLPSGIGQVDAQAELAVAIGTAVHRADPQPVLESVLGYTIGLDITVRGAQARDRPWTEAKSPVLWNRAPGTPC